MSRPLLIAIDGPAGAGKSTVARLVARHFGLPVLDTGAIYRSLALAAVRDGIPWESGTELATVAQALSITFEPAASPEQPQRVRLGSEDVTEAIRTARISQGASRVSAHAEVRAVLLELQRALSAGGCVAEGRDMGTVVFPGARHKFFLTADLDTRAARRRRDLVAAAADPDAVPALEDVREEVAKRDARDRTRATAPLRQADDAVAVDTSGLEVEAVVAAIVTRIEADLGSDS